MVEDRFEDEPTRPMDDLIDEDYEKYLEDMEGEEGEPMTREQFADWWLRY